MAATKFEKLLEAFQSNAYPAMIEDLAADLGVSPDAIRRLGLGWCPIAPFKGRDGGVYWNTKGWWAIPERDANAKVVGLGLRTQHHEKCMYPGSARGLIYEVNPDHVVGRQEAYRSSEDWENPSPCPICGSVNETQWCGVSPDGAVCRCMREKKGAIRPSNGGWIHILNAEVYAGNKRNAGPLIESPHPLLILEGATDVLKALSMGFQAIGRPNDKGELNKLRDLARGQRCLVVGENDPKADGRWPGKDGMMAAFDQLRLVSRDVQYLMPPIPRLKDFRAWMNGEGFTLEQFLDHAKEHAESIAECTQLHDDRPRTITLSYADQRLKLGSRSRLRFWQGDFYEYDGGQYAKRPKIEVEKPLRDWIYGISTFDEAEEKARPVPLKGDTNQVNNILQDVAAHTLIVSKTIPVWINGASGPDPKDLIAFQNGILNVPAYLAGEPNALMDPTPDLFTINALPILFDPTATCPLWHYSSDQWLGDEPAKIDFVQEWVGYNMVPNNAFEKFAFFKGPVRAGKGSIMTVLRNLLGEGNIANPNFSELGGRFGYHPLLGKLAAIVGDARALRGNEAMRGLEKVLTVTGNDAIDVDRKGKDALTCKALFCRLTIGSNGYLEVHDPDGALLSRACVVEFNRSFAANPDETLKARLLQELPGIALWGLEGLKRLLANRKFTVPASHLRGIEQWRLEVSPMASFLAECKEGGEKLWVSRQEFFSCWESWCRIKRIDAKTPQKVFEWLFAHCGAARQDVMEVKGQTFLIFRGIGLKAAARRKYLGGDENAA